jgi:hypothetical protein
MTEGEESSFVGMTDAESPVIPPLLLPFPPRASHRSIRAAGCLSREASSGGGEGIFLGVPRGEAPGPGWVQGRGREPPPLAGCGAAPRSDRALTSREVNGNFAGNQRGSAPAPDSGVPVCFT